jgi:putative oxidoreductase
MNTSILFTKYEPQIYAVLRVITGFLFLCHGSQKLFDLPHSAFVMPHNYVFYIAGPIEFIGGLLVMAGLWTRWAAFLCSGEMAYAYWSAHGLHALLPIANKGELSMLYCFLFLFIAARGAGIFSIDSLLNRSIVGPDFTKKT